MTWTNEHTLGLIPVLISAGDPRCVREQIESNYAHGGGFNPTPGFSLELGLPGKAKLHYPGDPALREWGRATINEELVIVFDCAFVAIVQRDGSFAVTRMD